MLIRYANSQETSSFASVLEQIIISRGVRRILEIGGGANPTFPFEFVSKYALEYTVLDISQGELDKAPQGYFKVLADITSPFLDLPGGYDLIFSKWLAEHVQSGEIFHRNVYRLLAHGAVAFHFFPTLYAPPYVVNRLMPERLAEGLLQMLQTGRDKKGKKAKFPAYYSWCLGPTQAQVKRFEHLGYRVDEYVGFFGHAPYYMKLPVLAKAHHALSNWLVRHPVPWLTSFAFVKLVKE